MGFFLKGENMEIKKITKLWRTIQKALEYAENIINTVREPLIVLDGDLKIVSASRSFYETFKVKPEETEGQFIYNLGNRQWNIPRLRHLLEDILRKNTSFDSFEVEHNFPYVGKRIMLLNARRIPPPPVKPRLMLLAIEDITEREKIKEKLKELYGKLLKSSKRLRKLAFRDSHTGLYNHHYFIDIVESEFSRAKRESTPLSVTLMDIDYFKSINDLYGHQFGDVILKQFGEKLKKIVRRHDTAIRYGGEEFIIVSSGTIRKEALILAKRFLRIIDSCNFGDKEHKIKLRVSAAVCSYPEDLMVNATDFINIADKILSKAKEDGGDRVYSLVDLGKTAKPAGGKESLIVKMLSGKIEKLTKRGNQSVVEAILAFAKTIEAKDHYTGQHVENTIRYATKVAEEIGLSKREIEIIKKAAILHDLGKIGISGKLLRKAGKLTKKEFKEVKKHPVIGASILGHVHFLHDVIPAIIHHHEWWNGKGYPEGLKGEAIPIEARVIAIADVYQALTSNRPYRRAYTKKKAIDIVKKGSGTQFDPKIVNAFLKVLKNKK